jgi:hypothetical protein
VEGITYRLRDLDVLDVSGGKMVGEVNFHGAVLLAVDRWPTKETELDLEATAGDVREKHLLGKLYSGRREGGRQCGHTAGGEAVGTCARGSGSGSRKERGSAQVERLKTAEQRVVSWRWRCGWSLGS